MATTIYGFKACDTVRKARAWLDKNKVEHSFFDYRVEQLDKKTVEDWFTRAGWETVFNRASTAFRELPQEVQAGLNEAKAKALILANTNLIKRPVLDTGKTLTFGFKPETYAALLPVH